MRWVVLLATACAALSVGACGETKDVSSPRDCTVLLIHGGGFEADSPAVNEASVRKAGVRLTLVDYPLGSVPRAYGAATRTARRYRLRRRVVALGESAGGPIAVWLAAHRQVDAAISIGGEMDFRHWPTRPEEHPATFAQRVGIAGHRWKWSPRRVYRRQRPVWQIRFAHDPVVPASAARLRGASWVPVPGRGHQVAPASIVKRIVEDACRPP